MHTEKKQQNADNKGSGAQAVADLAGVSTKTVSRVLNGEANVKGATRDRVLNAIETLGYKPSFTARALASKRSYCISILCLIPSGDYFSALHVGALSVCQQAGYHLFATFIEDYYELSRQQLKDKLQSILSNPVPESVILPPPFCDDDRILDYLDTHQIRSVRISSLRSSDEGTFIRIDERQAAYELTQYLIKGGHKRIALIKGAPTHTAANERVKGYLRALEEAGLAVDPSIILAGDFQFLSGLNAGMTLLGLKDRPTAVFSCNDEMAAGVSVAAHRAGLDIPADLSLVGFDDTSAAQLAWPNLTTVRQPLKEMAALAANIAMEQLPDNRGERDFILPHKLIIRESSGPAPDR